MSGNQENTPKIPDSSDVVTATPTRPPISRDKFIRQALESYESPLIGYASTLLNDSDLAKDVVQDTFSRLCQQEPEKVRDSLKSWLFTVCRNRALDLLRKDKRTEPLEDVRWKKVAGPDLQPDQEADKKERIGQLSRHLARLTENQRQVIILKFQQDLSYKEIQKITGFSSGNIGFLIHTGLKRLRDILPEDIRS